MSRCIPFVSVFWGPIWRPLQPLATLPCAVNSSYPAPSPPAGKTESSHWSEPSRRVAQGKWDYWWGGWTPWGERRNWQPPQRQRSQWMDHRLWKGSWKNVPYIKKFNRIMKLNTHSQQKWAQSHGRSTCTPDYSIARQSWHHSFIPPPQDTFISKFQHKFGRLRKSLGMILAYINFIV